MITNYILIGKKTCFMHFHPRLNSKSRLTCARIRPHGSEFTLNLGDKKVKKLDHVKNLGVVIDDELNWEACVKGAGGRGGGSSSKFSRN